MLNKCILKTMIPCLNEEEGKCCDESEIGKVQMVEGGSELCTGAAGVQCHSH